MIIKKYSKGPFVLNHEWLNDDLKGHVPISGAKNLALAQVVWVMEDDERAGKNSPEAEANAHLLGASFDLIEALIDLEEAARKVQAGEMPAASIQPERTKAQAAIIKALNYDPFKP